MLFFFVALIVWMNFRSTSIDFILDEHPADREATGQDRDQNGYFLLEEASALLPAKLVPYYAHDPDKPDDLKSYDVEAHSLGKLLDMARPDFHAHMLEYLTASEDAVEKITEALEKPYWVTPTPSLIESPYYENYPTFWEHGYFSMDYFSKLLLAYGLVELMHYENENRAIELITMSWNVIFRSSTILGEHFRVEHYLRSWYASILTYASICSDDQWILLKDLINGLRHHFDMKSLNHYYELVDNTIWFPDSPYYSKDHSNVGDAIEQTLFRGTMSKDIELLRKNMNQIKGLVEASFIDRRKWFTDPKNEDFVNEREISMAFYQPFGRKIASILNQPERVEMQRRANLVAMDIELFARKNGRYPNELSEVSFPSDCDYCKDPITNSPFEYVLSPPTYTIFRKGIEDFAHGNSNEESTVKILKWTFE
jgi:hypothetical protein